MVQTNAYRGHNVYLIQSFIELFLEVSHHAQHLWLLYTLSVKKSNHPIIQGHVISRYGILYLQNLPMQIKFLPFSLLDGLQ